MLLSAGYNTFEMDPAIASSSEDLLYSPSRKAVYQKTRLFAFALQSRNVFTACFDIRKSTTIRFCNYGIIIGV